jgi:hypothetical protein
MGRRTIRAWSLLGPGTHMTLLYASAAMAYVWPSAIYLCLLIFFGGMNALLAALVATGAGPVRA